jgi:hypothetical protein
MIVVRSAMFGAALAAAFALAACQPLSPIDSPADPAGARDDAYLPFNEPLRSELVGATVTVLRMLKTEHRCVNSRILRIPVAEAPAVVAHYREALEGWKPLALTSPWRTRVAGLTNGRAVFVIVQPAGSQNGYAGLGIVTDTAWDAVSKQRLAECLR